VSALGSILVYAVLIGLALWLLVLRPSRRQKARRMAIVTRLAPGSRVMLTSGLLARVVEIDDNEVLLDAGDGVHLRYVVRAIGTVLEEPEPSDDTASPDEEDGSEPGNSPPGPDVSDRET
jgi:preprotein translocase subunit YajC